MKFITLFALVCVASFAADAPVVSLVRNTGQMPLGLVNGGTFDFGTVNLGGLKREVFTLSSADASLLAGASISLIGADASDFALASIVSTELAPVAKLSFSVTYVPEIEGTVSTARLRVVSSDAPTPIFEVMLTATAGSRLLPVRVEEVGGAEVTALSVAYDFGSPMVGRSVSKTFRITNLGSASLESVSIARSDTWHIRVPWLMYIPEFVNFQEESGFTASPTSIPPIAPGGSEVFTVTWKPYETVAKTRTILLSCSNMAPFDGPTLSGLIYPYGPTWTPSEGQVKIQVTGAASPNTVDPAPLDGLHYRMGFSEESSSYTGPVRYFSMLPVESELKPAMLRWWSEATVADGPVPTSPYWRNSLAGSLALKAVTPTVFFDALVAVSGANSAAEKLGSRTATSFTSGTYLRHPQMKLPAQDNLGLELWFKPASLTGTQCIAFMGEQATAGMGLWLMDGMIAGRVGTATLSGPALAVDEWHHVVLMVQAGRATLRVDGVEVAVEQTVTLPSARGLGVGAMVDGANPFVGVVDEMRWFETPASGFDVSSHLLATDVPASALDRTSLDFGEVMAGAANAQSVVLRNDGPGWLRLLSVEVLGDGAGDYHYGIEFPRAVVPEPTPRPVQPMMWTGSVITMSRNLYPSSFSAALNALAPGTEVDVKVSHLAEILGQRAAKLRITTNDPVHPVQEIALNANTVAGRSMISVDAPAEWTWGSLLTTASVSRTFTIRNLGSRELTGINVSLIGPNAEDVELVRAPAADAVIAANSTVNPLLRSQPLSIDVSVKPRAEGLRSAILRIASDDPERPVLMIPILGRGLLPVPNLQMFAVGSRITQGGTLPMGSLMEGGQSVGLSLQMTNAGNGELNNLSASITGPNAADFQIDSVVPSFLQVSETKYLGIGFKPGGVGIRTATFRLVSNDPDDSPFEFVLTGNGLPAAPVMEVTTNGITPAHSNFLRFGTGVIGGSPPTQSLFIRNTGTAPLNSLVGRFTGAAAGDFSLSLPASLAPGTSQQVILSFAPQAIGPRSATLELTSNDTASDPCRLAVGGTGAYGPRSTLTPRPIGGWVGTAMAELKDGTLLMAGYFGDDPSLGHRIRAIAPSGSEQLDPWWELGNVAFSGTIRGLAATADGGFVVVGDFTQATLNGRLNTSATSGPDALQPTLNGQLGPKTVGAPTPLLSGIAKIMPSRTRTDLLGISGGPLKSSFQGRAVAALPDGKLMVGGTGKLGVRSNLIRLNADLSLDETFATPEPDGPVNALAVQDDGKVLVGGEFTNLGSDTWRAPIAPDIEATTIFLSLWESVAPHAGLCRLTVDGTDDPTFANRGFAKVTSLAVLGNRIAVGGMERRRTRSFVIAWGSSYGPIQLTYGEPVDSNMARLLRPSGTVVTETTTRKA